MSKLLVNGEWYERMLPAAAFEIDFEQLLLSYAKDLYPDFHLTKFKRRVTSPDGAAMADLALIDRLYRGWWVVEVELGSHSLSHVESQIAILANASYGADEADYLTGRNPHLDRGRLNQMMLGFPPRVVVLVNEAKPEWAAALRRWGVVVGVVEVFRSARNLDILRINGEQPEAGMAEVVSECHIDDVMRNSLVVASPANLTVRVGEQTTLLYSGGVTVWRRVDTNNRVWLMPIGRSPLAADEKHFVIEKTPFSQLSLRAMLTRERR